MFLATDGRSFPSKRDAYLAGVDVTTLVEQAPASAPVPVDASADVAARSAGTGDVLPSALASVDRDNAICDAMGLQRLRTIRAEGSTLWQGGIDAWNVKRNRMTTTIRDAADPIIDAVKAECRAYFVAEIKDLRLVSDGGKLFLRRTSTPAGKQGLAVEWAALREMSRSAFFRGVLPAWGHVQTMNAEEEACRAGFIQNRRAIFEAFPGFCKEVETMARTSIAVLPSEPATIEDAIDVMLAKRSTLVQAAAIKRDSLVQALLLNVKAEGLNASGPGSLKDLIDSVTRYHERSDNLVAVRAVQAEAGLMQREWTERYATV